MSKWVNGHFRIALWICVALCAPVSTEAQSEVLPIPVEVEQEKPAAICSIIGDVQFPGAFEFQHSPLNLSTILKRAGGIVADHDECVIKIVRKGDVVHHANYQLHQPGFETRLKADDIVIATVVGHAGHNRKAHHNHKIEVEHFALLGLSDSPLIVRLFDHDVTIDTLIHELKQAEGCSDHLKIIEGKGEQAVHQHGEPSHMLADGMVLIFDPTTINRAALPQIRNVPALPDTNTTDVQLVSQQVLADHKDLMQELEHAQPLNLADEANHKTQHDHEALQQQSIDEEIELAVNAEATQEQAIALPALYESVNWSALIGSLLFVVGLLWLWREFRSNQIQTPVRELGRSGRRMATSVIPNSIKSRPKLTSATATKNTQPRSHRVLMQLHDTRD